MLQVHSNNSSSARLMLGNMFKWCLHD